MKSIALVCALLGVGTLLLGADHHDSPAARSSAAWPPAGTEPPAASPIEPAVPWYGQWDAGRRRWVSGDRRWMIAPGATRWEPAGRVTTECYDLDGDGAPDGCRRKWIDYGPTPTLAAPPAEMREAAAEPARVEASILAPRVKPPRRDRGRSALNPGWANCKQRCRRFR